MTSKIKSLAKFNNVGRLRPASIFRFFNELTDQLLISPGVTDVLFVYSKGPSGPFIDYYELENLITPNTKFKTIILVKNDRGDTFKFPIQIAWDSYILSQKYPNKPQNCDTDLFDHVTSYSIAIVNQNAKNGLIVFDSFDHHPTLLTHPHHLHKEAGGKHGPAEEFSGMMADLILEIQKYI